MSSRPQSSQQRVLSIIFFQQIGPINPKWVSESLPSSIRGELTHNILLLPTRLATKIAPEEVRCVDECLSTEEECLLNSISMSACVEAFDACHRDCVPETPVVPATTQQNEEEDPNTSNNEMHQDVTQETEVTTPTTDEDLESEDEQDPGLTEEELEQTQDEKNQELTQEQPEEQVEEDDGFEEILPPKGGEDDEEFNDDPSDY
ncbi:hypothetical protein EDD21DRAFT_379923 [Dissophora ornata]|nr:hypothetical protein EDD21DRAFT_379923 [Dissophora ornata]